MNCLTNRRASPLYVASQRGNLDVVKYLLTRGANIEEKFDNGYTPLFIACVEGHPNVVETLCKSEAKINITCNNGNKLYDMTRTQCQEVLSKFLKKI